MKTTKKIPSKSLFLTLALLGTLAISAPAEAFNILKPRTVFIQGGGSGVFINGGTWTLVDLDQNVPGYCRYTVEWDSTGPGGNIVSGNVYLDEAKTGGHANCEINKRQDFPTSIYLAPGPAVTGFVPPAPPSQGIDRFGQLTNLSFLSLSEAAFPPALQGTVNFVTGSVYAIRIW